MLSPHVAVKKKENGSCPGHPPQTNRPDGMCFDANGNLTAESGTCPPGSPTYVYDAENRLTSYMGTGGTYTYDGNGLRVKKAASSTTTVYIFSGSKVIAEYENGASPTSPSREYIYSGAALLAKIEGGASTYFHPDQLSNRVLTDSTGNVLGQRGHYPFGETWYESGTTTKLKFTTYERDNESTNDYAMARTYINRFGRFPSADPIAGSTSDPQSLNHYTYGRNVPVSIIDPSGMTSSGCLYLKNLDTTSSSESSGGPSAFSDEDADTSPPEPQGPCPPGGSGGGGYPIGGGNIFDILLAWNSGDLDLGSRTTYVNGDPVEQDDPGNIFGLTLNIPDQCPLCGPMKGPEPPNDPIGSALKKLLDALKNDSDCLAFLSSKGISAMDVLDVVYEHAYGQVTYGQATMVPTRADNGNWSITNAVSYGPYASLVTVNTIGAFFRSTWPSPATGPLTTDRGGIRGGTERAQEFILLHELGHLTNATRPDANNQALIDSNDKDLESHCSKTISRFHQ